MVKAVIQWLGSLVVVSGKTEIAVPLNENLLAPILGVEREFPFQIVPTSRGEPDFKRNTVIENNTNNPQNRK